MDLFLAIILMTLIMLWTMILGMRLGKQASSSSQFGVQMLVVGVSCFYFLFLWNRPCLTRWLPHAALIILANWQAVIGSFFAGMYLSSGRIGRKRRLIVGPMTLVLAGYSIVAPVLGNAPTCIPASSASPLITQTTPYTCSPAAAASLLRLHGIPATESKMADLCLTRRGTHWMGVYRGLKLMTQRTPWKVVAESFSRKTLLSLHEAPALLSVDIDTDLIAAGYDHGFRGNTGHSVLALGAGGGDDVMVFDPAPSYGIECWDREILSWVSEGVILRLVRRDGSKRDAAVSTRIRRATLQTDKFSYISWKLRMKTGSQWKSLETGRQPILARVTGSMEFTTESRN